MKWVTWQHIMVDRMACAWLILRQVDPQAEFIFIPPGSKAIPEGAEAFDIPGTRLSHHRGHCSFYAFLKEYQIKDPVLQQIAQIVDEADVVQEVSVEFAPQVMVAPPWQVMVEQDAAAYPVPAACLVMLVG